MMNIDSKLIVWFVVCWIYLIISIESFEFEQQSPWLPLIKQRPKRTAPYKLPAGAKEINLNQDFKMTFKCEKDNDGFFADIDNDCKIFHRCHTDHNAGNRIEVQHYSFICGEGLVFDQSTYSCTRVDDAIPCDASEMFFNLNDRIGSDGPFLTEADIERAKAARPEYRRRRRRRGRNRRSHRRHHQ
ncbi:hypothetical protein DERP_010867 [Dermatophagoides pteronyssinus]|uniref:Uncharacterized protein LOC113788783 n=2 Tax=Dermatophagoides pteronyssinus TaxID=6956 RepID=A0A6P6XMP0_DERPT|nr:uncharacterized protein LOC113788783 [Dermatophagoides pteronyssinus]KAH9426300.1 hypothetical protein DERP_010867 [Dermatophagoides pteronyssinus]